VKILADKKDIDSSAYPIPYQYLVLALSVYCHLKFQLIRLGNRYVLWTAIS